MSGGIAVSGATGAGVDLSQFVDRDTFDAAVPFPSNALKDYSNNGVAHALGDVPMFCGPTGDTLVRVPAAYALDATNRAAMVAGGSNGLPLALSPVGAVPGGIADGTTPYSGITFTASQGWWFAGPQYDYAIVGTLPSGLTFTGGKRATATITGTINVGAQTGGPNSDGRYLVAITATDAIGQQVATAIVITVLGTGTALAFTPPTLPHGQVDAAYSFSLLPYVTGGTAPYTFTSAVLPADKILLDSNGSVTGTRGMLYSKTLSWGGVAEPPDTPTTLSIDVTVTDNVGATASGVVTLQIDTPASVYADLADLIGEPTAMVDAVWFGDAVVAATGQSQDLGHGGGGSCVEYLRTLLDRKCRIGGAGFFGIWRPEWTARTGFSAIATNTARDLGVWGGATATTAGGAWEDLTGSATNILKFSTGVNACAAFDIFYIDSSTYSGTPSYSIDAGANWTNITGQASPGTPAIKTFRVTGLSNPSSIWIRSRNAANNANAPCGIVGVEVFAVNPNTTPSLMVHNVAYPGGTLADLDHTSTGNPFAMLTKLNTRLAILGPFTTESSSSATFQTTLSSIIDKVRAAAPNATVVVVGQHYQQVQKFYTGGAASGGAGVTLTAGSPTIVGAAGTFSALDVKNALTVHSTVSGTPVLPTTTTPTGDAVRILTVNGDGSQATLNGNVPGGGSGVAILKTAFRTTANMDAYRAAAAAVAAAKSVQYVDFGDATTYANVYRLDYTIGSISATGDLNKAAALLYDNLHPSADGANTFANLVARKLNRVSWLPALVYPASSARAGQTISPSYNVAQINARAASMAAQSPQGEVRCTVGTTLAPREIVIGAAAGATTSGQLISSSCRRWNLLNVILRLADGQPSNPPSSNQAAHIFDLAGDLSSRVYANLHIDGNGINQSASDSTNPNYGFYCQGIRFTDCGPIVGYAIARNVRGVVGGKINTNDNTAADEVFFWTNFRGVGGDVVAIYLQADDGSGPTNTASGAKWHYIRQTSTPSVVLDPRARGTRHGFGGYCGGSLTFTLSQPRAIDGCGNGINVESGIPNVLSGTPASYPTKDVVIGSSAGATNGQASIGYCTTAAIVVNMNNDGSVAGRTGQINNVDVYGIDSINCARHLYMAQGNGSSAGPDGTVTLHHNRAYTPSIAALNYAATAGSAKHLALSAKVVLDTCEVSVGSVGCRAGNQVDNANAYGSTTGTWTKDL